MTAETVSRIREITPYTFALDDAEPARPLADDVPLEGITPQAPAIGSLASRLEFRTRQAMIGVDVLQLDKFAPAAVTALRARVDVRAHFLAP